MSHADQLKHDLEYVASAVRRTDQPVGMPSIYFLWAAIILVGFALPDFAPQFAGLYWLVCGIGGGLLTWRLAERAERRSGTLDRELGRRHGYHWLVGGIGFMVCWLPVLGGASIETVAGNFLLVAGLVYGLAGVHLERPLLWSGLLMLAAFAVLSVFAPPYTWTITGVAICASLVWAGLSSRGTQAPAIRK